jgi:hypothetical protein
MRLWTKASRKAAGFEANQSTSFSMRCELYHYIRTNLKDQEPATIDLTYDQLRKHAKAAHEGRKVSKGGKSAKRKRVGEEVVGAGGGGIPLVEEAQSDLLIGEWFDLAVAVSKEYVS